jgi:hypothetical protein
MNRLHEASEHIVPWKNIKQDKYRTSNMAKGKSPVHYVVSYCNIGVTGYLFNTSFDSWGDAWILDRSATIRFPSIVSIRFPGLPDFIFHNVLYLLEMERNLLSLLHIR